MVHSIKNKIRLFSILLATAGLLICSSCQKKGCPGEITQQEVQEKTDNA